MKRCANCGQENDDWRPFCTRCGASYSGPAAEPVVAAAPPGAPPAPAAPPPPGVPAAPGSPGAPRPEPRRPSGALIAVAAVVAVVVAVGAFVGISAVGSRDGKASAPTTTFPSAWDPRVADLITFDTAQRKLSYTHPVKVVFLSKAEFKKRVTTDGSTLTAKDRRDIQHATEELRALGMLEGKVDLFARLNQLNGSSILAFYDSKKKEVVIPGSALDVEQKVTLAHELTHTLDDEHFDLTRLNKLGDKYGTDAVTALIEGDATWVENRYIAKLSSADRKAYDKSQQGQGNPADFAGVPKIFEVLQQWPYDFGNQFVSILQNDGGQSRVDEAFKSPPVDQEQVIDPIAFLNNDRPGAITMPPLPRGAKKLDSGKEFGALMWYLVLSERIDAHTALKAALGWGADAYDVAAESGRTCINVHYRGETRGDNTEMMNALRTWIAALPKGMASVKANSDDTLSLHSCDPGVSAKVVTDRSIAAYQLLLFRVAIIKEFMQVGLKPRLATCAADAVTDQTSLSELAGNGPAVLNDVAAMRQIGAVCSAKIATERPPARIDK
jgi:hypothetical protein